MQDAHRSTVAVVDDDQAVRDSLRFLLETVGFDVDTFTSACDFLSSSERAQPAYLLIDQHMPRLTGLDLLGLMRDQGISAMVALMTGAPSPELSRRAMELGADVVLEKPVAEEVLLRFLGYDGQ